jgi:sugar phosphate isomerase/epimerase
MHKMSINLNRRGLLAGMGALGFAAAAPAIAAPRKPFFAKLNKTIGLQLYTLGDAATKDLDGTLAKLAAIGYREIELPGFYGMDPKALRAAADKAGLRYTSMHMTLPARVPPGSLTLMSSPQEIADALGTLGIHQAVLPMPLLPDNWSPPAPGGDMRAALIAGVEAGGLDMWKRLGGVLNERAAALKPHGIDLGYHNHNMEFKPQGGTTGWEVLTKELDPKLVFLELDLGWTTAAGHDAATEIAKLKGRIRMVHLKDVKPTTKTNYTLQQDPTEVGSGKLDWHRILPACAASGVTNYFVEQEPPFASDRFTAVKKSFDFLSHFVA